MKIPMKSVHDAMRGKHLLRAANIRGNIGKESGEHGCSYYLQVAEHNYPHAMSILNKNQLF